MTRSDAGGSHHRWTTSELGRVSELAGRVPPEEICRELGVTRGQLDNARRVINASGGSVSLRFYRHRLEICPACGCRRSTLGRHGMCEPCRRARQLERIEARAAELLARLPQEERRVYESTESMRESAAAGPMPKAPDTSGMSRYEAERASELHDEEVERWMCALLYRRVRAAQKRKERIARKARNA